MSGPSSVVEAMAAGRSAADAIDRFLGGSGVAEGEKADDVRDDPFLGRDESFHKRAAFQPKFADPATRIQGYGVIEESLTPDEAQSFASMCLRCHLRATITPVVLPPDRWKPLNPETIGSVPATEGVYQLADASKKVIRIAGVADLAAGLREELEKQPEGTLFCWEEDRMYSQRESELIQQHLQQYGEMPGGGDNDLDDLF